MSGSSLNVFENRTRVPSQYLRELTLGKFVVKSKNITLLECIGEGIPLNNGHTLGSIVLSIIERLSSLVAALKYPLYPYWECPANDATYLMQGSLV